MDSGPAGLLMDWWAYSKLEPFGEYRADLRTGIVAATLANMARRKGTPTKKASDFVVVKPVSTNVAATGGAVTALVQKMAQSGIGKWLKTSSET